MCCVHVVPLLGYEQINISDGRRGSSRHADMVMEMIGQQAAARAWEGRSSWLMMLCSSHALALSIKR
eukprot:scaffold7802_cov115-Skeletonema_dohrnii-CCMP3373.AAC.4